MKWFWFCRFFSVNISNLTSGEGIHIYVLINETCYLSYELNARKLHVNGDFVQNVIFYTFGMKFISVNVGLKESLRNILH